MAASASVSLYNPRSFSFSSSTPSKHLPLPHLTIPGQSISFPLRTSRVIDDGYRYGKRSFFRTSVSAHRENQPYQRNNGEKSGSDAFPMPEGVADEELPSSLSSLIQAYRKAIVYGDRKLINEVEQMMFVIEKEKNELAKKVSDLTAEISSGKEKYVRLQADFDNYRKRSEKERLKLRSDARGEVIESLLPMVDSFERAKQQIKLETESEKKIDSSYQGIYKQLVEIMRSLRVAAVPSVGRPFDPSVHEAIAREESYEYKEGIVTQELRRGFYLGDRLIRAAMVKVSSGPGKTAAAAAASVAGADNLKN